MTTVAFTTAYGMGPLPRMLERACGAAALERVFRAESIPLWLAQNQNERLPLRSLMGLLERAAREMGDHQFGLNLGMEMNPEDYGPVGRYIGTAPTLLEMIMRSGRAVPYHASRCKFGLLVADGLAYWQFCNYDSFTIGRRHQADHVIPPALQGMRRFLGPSWLPLRLEVEYDRPPNWRTLEEWIGVPVVYGAIANAFVFDEALLYNTPHREIPAKEAMTWRELRQFAQRRPPRTHVEAAREVLRMRLFDASVDIDGTAKLLGIASRTLQRQLAEENLTYRDLVQQLRMQRAADLLRESAEPVTSIAYALGYSDLASFTRAFRQWTGRPPSHYRRDAPSVSAL